ncbi:MAG: hypothetical protein K5637_08935 [Lachnospiraceae bacterium]|nr:hypothetical protein [Lachnospiraceae bacterium]
MNKILPKADEMEMSINYKSARNAYAFLVLALAVYCLVYTLKTGELPFVFLPFAVSGVIFWGTKLIETRHLTAAGDPDEE